VFWLRHLGLDSYVVEADEEIGYCLLGSALDILDPFFSFAPEESVLEVVVGIFEEFLEGEGVAFEYCLVILAVVSGPLFGYS